MAPMVADLTRAIRTPLLFGPRRDTHNMVTYKASRFLRIGGEFGLWQGR